MIARMLTEIYTAFAYGLDLDKLGKSIREEPETIDLSPAICFFEDSPQHHEFCELQKCNADFQYLLTQVKVFYITTKGPKEGVTEFVIHDNDVEPLKCPAGNVADPDAKENT